MYGLEWLRSIRDGLFSRQRTAWLWLLIALAITRAPVSAQSPSEPPPYTGLDIVFLVDQSGSMGGQAYGFDPGGVGTDPLELRFEGVQYAIDTLGQYKLTFAPEIDIQATVINFGDQADNAAASWQQIAPGNDPATWDSLREPILESLSADQFRTRHDPANLGNTNFINAFEAAQIAFNQLPTDPASPHLRVVILLTDGSPCVPAQFDCDSPAAQGQHMQQVLSLTQNSFPSPDYRLYVLALDDEGDLWSRWEDRWQQIVNLPERATRVQSSQEIGVRFLNILTELVSAVRLEAFQPPQSLVPGQNTFQIPPFIREVRLSIFKSTASPGLLEVIQPDSRPLTDSDPSLTIANRNRPIEVWTIQNPTPGDWTFIVGSTNDRVDVYLDLIPIEVTATVEGGYFLQGDDITLAVQLQDSAGDPLPDYGTDVGLQVIAQITAPDGTRSETPLSLQADATYTTTWQAALVGLHQMGIRATSQLNGSNFLILERDNVGNFDVKGVRFEADSLPMNQFLVSDNLDLNVSLTDTDGATLPLSGITVSAALSRDNQPLGEQNLIDLGGGRYNLTYPLEAPGEYQIVLTASAIRPDSTVLNLGAPIATRFRVIPSLPVSLNLLTPPTAESSQYSTEALPPFLPTDLIVEFEVSAEGSPVEWENIASAGSAFAVTASQDGIPLTSVPAVMPVGQGRYQLRFTGLSTGRLEVSVEATGLLTSNYVMSNTARQLSLTVIRQVHPNIYILAGAASLFTISAAGLIALRLYRMRQLRRHPARGTLVIREQHNGAELWRLEMDRLRSNTIVRSDKRLRKANITELVIRCTDDRMSEARRVKVTARNVTTTVVDDRIISPGGPAVPLSGGRGDLSGIIQPTERIIYEIVKDPDN
jgi:hypothetical protein